ncbi:MAG: LysR family transcriptional regulator [Sphingomonadales bacterium]|nr:MAG: LysR family transcriptional regulator [Sphingomonadales bacterium]
MDLKHLQDFVSLCNTRSFSRSSVARNVTQSAFSRRIQALELWLGTALVDRSTYPTTLTAEGRLFRETAEEVLSLLENARADIQARRKGSRKTISFAALHTLAMSVFPAWLSEIEAELGPLKTELFADNFHNCMQSLVEGRSDFLLTFHHDAVPISIDGERFPFLVIGADRLLAVSAVVDGAPLFPLGGETPLLAYGQDSFLGRLSTHAAGVFGVDLVTSHVNDNAVAEILKAMVIAGHGIAWLPESLIRRELAEGVLHSLGPELPIEVRLYRSAEKTRAAVVNLWATAKSLL